MAVPWWLIPGMMFGASTYIKSMGSRGKYRWIAAPELDVRSQSILAVVTNAESGDALPAPPSGYRWKPIQLTFQSGPLAAPAVVEINVLEAVEQSATGTAGFLTVQHLRGFGFVPHPHPHGGGHHHGGGGRTTVVYGGDYGYGYPLYAEALPTVISPTETWTVEWTANGKKQHQTFNNELDARRLKDSLAASKIAATITRGGVI